MDQGDPIIAKLREAICRYLAANPQAKDSAQGVGRLWLGQATVALPLVQKALDLLVQDGKIAKTTLIDGTVVYHALRPPCRSNSTP